MSEIQNPAEVQQDDEREPCFCCGCITDACQCDCCCALAARPSAGTEALRDALRLIAGPAPHCSASTTEHHACRQPSSGRTRGAQYGADAWCNQCIAYTALDGEQ